MPASLEGIAPTSLGVPSDSVTCTRTFFFGPDRIWSARLSVTRLRTSPPNVDNPISINNEHGEHNEKGPIAVGACWRHLRGPDGIIRPNPG